MANEYAVNQADLTAIADAIRSKGGTSGALEFPGGFVDAVGAIKGNSEPYTVDSSGEPSMPEFTVERADVKTIAGLNGSNVVKIDCPNATKIRQLENCAKLTYVNFENVTQISDWQITNVAIKEAIVPKITTLGYRTFNACGALTYVRMDMCADTGWMWSLCQCGALKTAVFPSLIRITQAFLYECKSLNALVLGSASVCELTDVGSALKSTPLRGISGVYSGHVYVPSALIPEYQTATNWATLYANYPEIFQPIEGSEYEE